MVRHKLLLPQIEESDEDDEDDEAGRQRDEQRHRRRLVQRRRVLETRPGIELRVRRQRIVHRTQITVAEILVRAAADVCRIEVRHEAAPALHEAGFFRRQAAVRPLRKNFVGVRVGDHLDGGKAFRAGLRDAGAVDVRICVRAVAVTVTC